VKQYSNVVNILIPNNTTKWYFWLIIYEQVKLTNEITG